MSVNPVVSLNYIILNLKFKIIIIFKFFIINSPLPRVSLQASFLAQKDEKHVNVMFN